MNTKQAEREDLTKLINSWIEQEKFGKITINFFRGHIQNVKIEQTVLHSKQKNA